MRSVPDPPPDAPDLAGVIASANAAGLRFVVIGGFAVIAHQHLRATEDVDLLVPDDPGDVEALLLFLQEVEARWHGREGAPSDEVVRTSHHLRVATRHGLVDLLKEGAPPLDFETVRGDALVVNYEGEDAPVAGLKSLSALKRLAGRPIDQLDLEALERIHGPLP
jgi:hypothetical protein